MHRDAAGLGPAGRPTIRAGVNFPSGTGGPPRWHSHAGAVIDEVAPTLHGVVMAGREP